MRDAVTVMILGVIAGLLIGMLIIQAADKPVQREPVYIPIMPEMEYELPEYEDTVEYVEPVMIRCTVYDDMGYTRSGQYVRDGIIAGKREWLGNTAILYQVNEDGTRGDFIGYYEFLDTGGEYIESGQRIDVWTPYPDEWVKQYGDYVYMQMIKGVG